MTTKRGYSVVIVEVNEIAGEQVRCKVAVHNSRTMQACRDYCTRTWGASLPRGTVILDNRDGEEYRPYGTGF